MSQKYCTLEDEYERNKKLKKEDVCIIQEWVNSQAHLPKISEHKIIAFLTSCLYKKEVVKEYIDKFYTRKTRLTQFTTNWNVFSDEIQQALDMLLVRVLPVRTEENYQLVYIRLMDPNSSLFYYLECIKTFAMMMCLWFKIAGTAEGQVVIVDAEGFSFGHMWQMASPSITKDLFSLLAVTPVILKAIHVINVSYIIDRFVSYLKPLLPTGTIDMVHLHTSIDTLLPHVPQEALPTEYGGQAGSLEILHESLVELMEENAEYFLEEEKEIVDETKRLLPLNDAAEVVPVEENVAASIKF